jgi:hypothetical protein
MKKWSKPQIVILDVVATEKMKMSHKFNKHKPRHS